jgi:O-succinylbenzoic acid--CoA ligase
MSDLLSIRAAADEAGDAIALCCGGRAHSFAELAARVDAELRAFDARFDGRPYPLVATAKLATVITLLALLELRVPALLLHPRLTPAEREALLADAQRAGSVPHADAAAIIHTSGTTGTPRAAVLTRAALVASARASASNLGWQPEDRWLACMPLARVGGLSILTRCLAARRAVVLAPGFDPDAFPAVLEDERVTLASLVPTMLARVLDAHPDWRPPARLRAVLVGGAHAPARLLGRAALRRVPVVVTYGMTETCSQVAATPYGERYAAAACGAGRPLDGVELRVADGRIEVRGPMRMAGYWGEPPLAPEAWFDTGDMGAIDQRGFLQVHARRGDLIVTGGENVYPAEVERELERCPGIDEAAVFGLPDETWGQTVAAALVVDPARAPRDDELCAWIRTRLATHKRPRRICRVGRLPHTAAGKLDRDALAAFAPLLGTLDESS